MWSFAQALSSSPSEGGKAQCRSTTPCILEKPTRGKYYTRHKYVSIMQSWRHATGAPAWRRRACSRRTSLNKYDLDHRICVVLRASPFVEGKTKCRSTTPCILEKPTREKDYTRQKYVSIVQSWRHATGAPTWRRLACSRRTSLNTYDLDQSHSRGPSRKPFRGRENEVSIHNPVYPREAYT